LKHFLLVPGNPGVLCKRAKDVARVFQALTENNLQNKIDNKVAPISWNSQVNFKSCEVENSALILLALIQQTFDSRERVRIGFLSSVGPLTPIGDTPEVLLKAKAYFESAGHIVVPFTLPFDMSKVEELPWDPDTYGRLDSLLRYDQVYEGISGLYNKDLRPAQEPSLPSEYRDYLMERELLVDSLLDAMKSQDIDLLLCPVFPFPALNANDAQILLGLLHYYNSKKLKTFICDYMRLLTYS